MLRRGKVLLIAGLAVAALFVAPGNGVADPVYSVGARFVPVDPLRVLDTRTGGGQVPPQGEVVIDLSSRVPAEATTVVLNLTGVAPTTATHLTVWQAEDPRPVSSNLNLRAGEIRANAVTVGLGQSRRLRVFNNSGNVDVVADLAGYYAQQTGSTIVGSGFRDINPVRMLDTRVSGGPLGPGGTRVVDLSSQVPANATAVTFNLTGASATASTFVTAWPTGQPRPTASTLNLLPGEITPNHVTVALGADRTITLYNLAGDTHLLVDLAGYYAPDSGLPFYQLSPVRVFDSRPGPFLFPNNASNVDLSAYVPEGAATAAVFNLTGTDVTEQTFLTAYPTGQPRQSASNLNLLAGQTSANLVTVPLWTSDSVDIYNLAGHGNVVIDLVGYFGVVPDICFGAYCPYTWGTNRHGQLGVGTTGGFSGEPGRAEARQDDFQDVTAVAVNEVNGYALTRSAGLFAWGSNQFQGLANGRTDGMAPQPLEVRDTGQVTQLAAGARTVYVRSADGVVRAWGDNRDGALGDGTTEVRTSVVFVDLPVDVTAVAAGRSTGYALRADGTVWAWGRNGGMLGTGSYGTGCETTPAGAGCRALRPVQVPGLTDVVSIAATPAAAFAVRSDGSVLAWGWNAEGQLGIGTAGGASCHTNPSGPNCVATAPVLVPGLTGVAKIVGGAGATYALKADGTVLSWGDNSLGQLGTGTTGGVSPTPAAVPGLTGVTDLAAGTAHVLALRSDHRVWSWGDNSAGQLGLPAAVNTPTQARGTLYAYAIAAGGQSSIAIGQPS